MGSVLLQYDLGGIKSRRNKILDFKIVTSYSMIKEKQMCK